MRVHPSRTTLVRFLRRTAVGLAVATTMFFGQSVKKACAGCEYPYQIHTTYYQYPSCPTRLCTPSGEAWPVGESWLACDGTYTTTGNTTNYLYYESEETRCAEPVCD